MCDLRHVELPDVIIFDHTVHTADVVIVRVRCNDHIQLFYPFIFEERLDDGIILCLSRINEHGPSVRREQKNAITLPDVQHIDFQCF